MEDLLQRSGHSSAREIKTRSHLFHLNALLLTPKLMDADNLYCAGFAFVTVVWTAKVLPESLSLALK